MRQVLRSHAVAQLSQSQRIGHASWRKSTARNRRASHQRRRKSAGSARCVRSARLGKSAAPTSSSSRWKRRSFHVERAHFRRPTGAPEKICGSPKKWGHGERAGITHPSLFGTYARRFVMGAALAEGDRRRKSSRGAQACVARVANRTRPARYVLASEQLARTMAAKKLNRRSERDRTSIRRRRACRAGARGARTNR